MKAPKYFHELTDEDAIYGDAKQNEADLIVIGEAISVLNRQAMLTKFTPEERSELKKVSQSLCYVLMELEDSLSVC